MQQLLTQALQQGTHVMRDVCDPQGSTTAELLKHSRAADKQQRWLDVVQQLLSMRAAQALPAGALGELLQCTLSHGLLAATEFLLVLPAAQQLGAASMEQLLSECLSLNPKHFAHRQITQHRLLELLVQQPAVTQLDAKAVSRLLLRLGNSLSAGSHTHSADALAGNPRDPGDVLAGLLAALPCVRQCDADRMTVVLSAAVQARVHPRVLELLLKAPASTALSTEQLKKLLSVCAQHCYGQALDLVLQHPAAPLACTDAQVQLYASLMETLCSPSPAMHMP
jgi:Zn finger protein HypA/HybF involved in hydrogenase expression